MHRWPSPFFLVRRIINQRTVSLLLFPRTSSALALSLYPSGAESSTPVFPSAAKHFHIPALQHTRGKKGPLLPLPLLRCTSFFPSPPSSLSPSDQGGAPARLDGGEEDAPLSLSSPLSASVPRSHAFQRSAAAAAPRERERERIRERGQRRGAATFCGEGIGRGRSFLAMLAFSISVPPLFPPPSAPAYFCLLPLPVGPGLKMASPFFSSTPFLAH